MTHDGDLQHVPVRPTAWRARSVSHSHRRCVLRVTAMLVIVASVTFVSLWGILWWSDRPLRTARQRLEREEYHQVLDAVGAFLATHPGDTRAGILKARALSGLHRHRQADAAFVRVAQQTNGFPDNVAALRDWADTLLHLKQWNRAVALLQTVLKSDPDDADALYKISVAHIRLKRFDAALQSTKQLGQVPGRKDQADVMIGTIYHDTGKPRQALTTWQKVLKSNPDAKDLQISAAEFLTMVSDERVR